MCSDTMVCAMHHVARSGCGTTADIGGILRRSTRQKKTRWHRQVLSSLKLERLQLMKKKQSQKPHRLPAIPGFLLLSDFSSALAAYGLHWTQTSLPQVRNPFFMATHVRCLMQHLPVSRLVGS